MIKINLAICVYPDDGITSKGLSDKLLEYSLSYALKCKEATHDIQEVYQSSSIEQGLQDLSSTHEHLLFIAAGTRIYESSIIDDVVKFIQDNKNYLAITDIYDWKSNWYELHHSFLLINCKAWKLSGCPMFGGWDISEDDLPEIERSQESYFEDFAPYWIKFTGNYSKTIHYKQGWNFIKQAAIHQFDILSWNATVKNKKIYYYPEVDSDIFLEAIKTTDSSKISNFNQKAFITETHVTQQNSQFLDTSIDVSLNLMNNQYDTVILPADGIMFLKFMNTIVNPNTNLIIYSHNSINLEVCTNLYNQKNLSFREILEQYTMLQPFWFKQEQIFLSNTNKDACDNHIVLNDVYYILEKIFGSLGELQESCNTYRSITNVQWVKTCVLEEFSILNEKIRGKSFCHISNIFSRDETIAKYSMQHLLKQLRIIISSLEDTTTTLVGYDPCNRPILKNFNSQYEIKLYDIL